MAYTSVTWTYISEMIIFFKKYGLYACASLTCYFAWVNLWLPITLFTAMLFDSIIWYLAAYKKWVNPTSHELIYWFWTKMVAYTVIIWSAFLIWLAISTTFWVPFNDWTVLMKDWNAISEILSIVWVWSLWMDDFINWGLILIMVWELKSVISNVNIVLWSKKTKELDLFLDMFHKLFWFIRSLVDRKAKDANWQKPEQSEPIV